MFFWTVYVFGSHKYQRINLIQLQQLRELLVSVSARIYIDRHITRLVPESVKKLKRLYTSTRSSRNAYQRIQEILFLSHWKRRKKKEEEKRRKKRRKKSNTDHVSFITSGLFRPLCKQNVWVADTTFKTFLFHFRLIRLDWIEWVALLLCPLRMKPGARLLVCPTRNSACLMRRLRWSRWATATGEHPSQLILCICYVQ